MKMKTLLKWVFPALLGIVPAFGMELAEIKDDFFLKAKIVTPGGVIQRGNNFFMSVDATQDEANTQSKRFPCDYTRTKWEYHDEASPPFAKEVGNASLFCGNTELTIRDYVSSTEHPYALIGKGEGRFIDGIQLKDTDSLPIGKRVQVCEVLKYKRPGDLGEAAPVEKRGDTLYELLLEETRTPGAEFRHCQREWQEISRFKKITRHQVQTYTRTDVTQITYRLPIGTDEKIEMSKNQIAELKPKAGGYEGEVPTCGEKVLPTNHRFV